MGVSWGEEGGLFCGGLGRGDFGGGVFEHGGHFGCSIFSLLLVLLVCVLVLVVFFYAGWRSDNKTWGEGRFMYTKALSYLDLDVLSQACTVQGVFPRPEKVRITTKLLSNIRATE